MASLDRRLTIRVCTTSHSVFGEPVPVVTDYPVWALLVQDGVARSIEVGGTYGLASRVWRVRFDKRIIDAHAAGAEVAVVYGAEDAEVDIVTSVGEPDTMRGEKRRRRFLDLLS